jgi:hypothetical protein
MMWTPELIDELLRQYRAGTSAAVTAKQFGTTRNAVLGKIHRELIKRGERVETQVKSDTVAKRKYTRSEAMLTLPDRAESVSVYVAPKPVAPDLGQLASIVDVTGCKWPVQDDLAFVGGIAFCNHEAADGSSYCPWHRERATLKVKPKPVLSLGPIGLRFEKRRAA